MGPKAPKRIERGRSALSIRFSRVKFRPILRKLQQNRKPQPATTKNAPCICLPFVLAQAAKQKLLQAVLEVRARNQAAIGLYEHLSFTQDGYRPQYYPPLEEGGPKEDALLMSRSLR